MGNKLKWITLLGLVESGSLLILLFICSPLKYLAGWSEPVRWMGMIHGVLFLMYVGSLFSAFENHEMNMKTKFLGVVLSAVPFGPIWFHGKAIKTLELQGIPQKE